METEETESRPHRDRDPDPDETRAGETATGAEAEPRTLLKKKQRRWTLQGAEYNLNLASLADNQINDQTSNQIDPCPNPTRTRVVEAAVFWRACL